jgi:hypothetical protein
LGVVALAFAWQLRAEDNASPLSQPVLRHRVVVIALPPSGGSTNQANTVLVKSEAWQALLLNEGVTITPDEWATAVDLTKATLGESDTFRVVEMPGAGDAAENAPGLVLLARYGVGLNGTRAFFRLVEAKSGSLLTSADATATALKTAIEKALSKIQSEAALLPWRCHVVGVNGDLMVIDRGRLDGIRVGHEFIGYTLDKAATNATALPDEQRMMQYGKRTGIYKVVEEGQVFSKAQGKENAVALKAGDILEQPEIRMKDRGRASRGRRVWDGIYQHTESERGAKQWQE